MEPRLDNGDDLGRLARRQQGDGAAMEPRLDNGDDLAALPHHEVLYVPQWSPVSTTGTTS